MSETRRYTGKVERIDRALNRDIEALARDIRNGAKLDSMYDSHLEALLDEGDYKKYVALDGELYETSDVVESDADEDIFVAKKTGLDQYEFEVQFYDGGCSFSEAVETALGRVDKEDVPESKDSSPIRVDNASIHRNHIGTWSQTYVIQLNNQYFELSEDMFESLAKVIDLPPHISLNIG